MAEQTLQVVLFAGGSGAKNITEHFAPHPQISLTILINCYDDGHSTGRLRKFIPGMLGPSDVRKNVNRLMPRTEQRHTALRFLSDYRLPRTLSFKDGMSVCERVVEGRTLELPGELALHFEQ